MSNPAKAYHRRRSPPGHGHSKIMMCGRGWVQGRSTQYAARRVAHVVHYRGGNIAVEVVADEQHSFGETPGSSQHQLEEEGPVPDA
jgi:hypothetical protein